MSLHRVHCIAAVHQTLKFDDDLAYVFRAAGLVRPPVVSDNMFEHGMVFFASASDSQ